MSHKRATKLRKKDEGQRKERENHHFDLDAEGATNGLVAYTSMCPGSAVHGMGATCMTLTLNMLVRKLSDVGILHAVRSVDHIPRYRGECVEQFGVEDVARSSRRHRHQRGGPVEWSCLYSG